MPSWLQSWGTMTCFVTWNFSFALVPFCFVRTEAVRGPCFNNSAAKTTLHALRWSQPYNTVKSHMGLVEMHFWTWCAVETTKFNFKMGLWYDLIIMNVTLFDRMHIYTYIICIILHCDFFILFFLNQILKYNYMCHNLFIFFNYLIVTYLIDNHLLLFDK